MKNRAARDRAPRAAGLCALLALFATACASPGGPDVPGGQPDGQIAWTAVPQAPLSARHEAVGRWVAGRFLVVGGWGGPPCPENASCAAPPLPALRDGAAYEPVTRSWTRIADAPVPVNLLSAVATVDRLYLLSADQGSRGFLGYDPATDTWTTYPAPPQPGQLVALGESVAVIPGSDETTTAVDAVFDQDDRRWRRLPDDPLGPSFDREALVVDGRLLLAAKDLVPNPGSEKPALVRLARLSSDGTWWEKLPDSEIIGWGPVLAGNRVVWPATGSADGGEVNGWGRSYPEGGIYDPATGTWTTLPEYPGRATGRWCCSGAVLGDRVLVMDRLLDPVTREWTRLPVLPGGVRVSAAVASGPDAVLVWGGATSGNRPENLDDGYLLSLRP